MLANLPELPQAFASQEYGAEGEKLLRICVGLQRAVGADGVNFFLSCRTAGPALGLSHQDAAVLMRGLVSDGWLVLVTKGAGTKASRYHMPLAVETTAEEQP
jgi:hypothetical protein